MLKEILNLPTAAKKKQQQLIRMLFWVLLVVDPKSAVLNWQSTWFLAKQFNAENDDASDHLAAESSGVGAGPNCSVL